MSGLAVGLANNLAVCGVFTVVNLVWSYCLRRLFKSEMVFLKQALP